MTKQAHHRDICVLTNGLSSAIRWRLDDYAHMLRAQLALLAAPEPFALQAVPALLKRPRPRSAHPHPR